MSRRRSFFLHSLSGTLSGASSTISSISSISNHAFCFISPSFSFHFSQDPQDREYLLLEAAADNNNGNFSDDDDDDGADDGDVMIIVNGRLRRGGAALRGSKHRRADGEGHREQRRNQLPRRVCAVACEQRQQRQKRSRRPQLRDLRVHGVQLPFDFSFRGSEVPVEVCIT